MNRKYVYHGIDITLDTYEKICSVVEIIAEKDHQSFDEAYLKFSLTRVYSALENTATMMWSESAEYIVDEYYREIEMSRGAS